MQQVTNIQAIETATNQFGDVVVSRNKRNKLVFMSMEEYRKKLLDEEIDRKLLQAEEDYKNGRVKDAEDVFKEWKAKYDI